MEPLADEGAVEPHAKRAKAALDNDSFERVPKILTLVFGGEESQEEGSQETTEAKAVEHRMGRRHRGSLVYDVGGEKVVVDWLLVREGDTERDVAVSALRSQPVSSLSSSSSSSSPSSSSLPSAAFSQANTSGPWQLQLTYRMVRKREKSGLEDVNAREVEQVLEGESEFVAYPLPGSLEEDRMNRQRKRQAKKAHLKTVKELEEAIKNNVIEMHRLTDDETTPDEDITPITSELRYLKAKLRALKAPEAEVRYELSGKDLLFELKLGDRVVLEGLPGCPSVVWSADGGSARSHEREWRSSRSMLMADGTAELSVEWR